MSHVSAFVSRITSQAPAFDTVAEAWTIKPIDDFTSTMPAALVYLAGVESEANGLDTEVRQEQIITIGVLIVCEIAQLETRRSDLESALVGWEPETGSDLAEHESGEILDIRGNVAWWRETYSFRRWLRV